MKIRLTREESQHLIDLGAPKEKASENTLETRDYCPPYMNTIRDMSYPIFTLTDLLEILPKEIAKGQNIEMDWGSDIWSVNYVNNISSISQAEELIDALYKLTCWYYGEYLKKEKK